MCAHAPHAFDAAVLVDYRNSIFHPTQGAARLITSPTYLSAATGIMAIEAYHADLIREQLIQISEQDIAAPFNDDVWQTVQVRNAFSTRFAILAAQ